MGEIINMQKKFNNINKERTRKPRFEFRKGHIFEDWTTLTFKKNLNKSYRLNTKYKNLQIGSRITIAALATALGLGIGNATLNNNTTTQNVEQTEYAIEQLTRESVQKDYEQKLSECIFGNELNNIDEPYFSYITNKDDGITTLKVTSGNKIFVYSNSTLALDPMFTNRDIVKLLNNLIYLNEHKDISQEKLQEFNKLNDSIDSKNFELKGSHIVSVKDNDIDNER